MPIHFQCDACGKTTRAPDSLAGKKAKCPHCQAVIQVPEAELAEEVPAEPAESYGVAPEPATTDEPRRPCPVCGEMILTSAVKCRFCGEIFDKELRKAEKKKARANDADSVITTSDWVAIVLCPGIACIGGIVYLIQGKPKAGKIIGYSFCMSLLWSVIRVLIEKAAEK